MTIKRCRNCKKTKPIEDFPLRGKGKRRPDCKECYNAKYRVVFRRYEQSEQGQSTRHIYEQSERGKTTRKAYKESECGRATRKRIKKKYREKHPERHRLCNFIYRAKQKGVLRIQHCIKCSTNKNIVAHHEDYSKPLNVTWLCNKCHAKLHAAKRKTEAA